MQPVVGNAAEATESQGRLLITSYAKMQRCPASECLMDSWETIAHTEKTPAGEWGRPPGGGCFNEHVHNMVDVGIRY